MSQNQDNRKSAKDASFWELLADKKGEKFIPTGAKIPTNEEIVANSGQEPKATTNPSTSSDNKQVNQSKPEATKTSTQSSSEQQAPVGSEHLKNVSFWELLKDKDGKKYKPAAANNEDVSKDIAKQDNKEVVQAQNPTPTAVNQSTADSKTNQEAVVKDTQEVKASANTGTPSNVNKPASKADEKKNRKSTSAKKTKKKKKSKAGLIILLIVVALLIGGGVFVGLNWEKTKAWYASTFGGGNNTTADNLLSNLNLDDAKALLNNNLADSLQDAMNDALANVSDTNEVNDSLITTQDTSNAILADNSQVETTEDIEVEKEVEKTNETENVADNNESTSINTDNVDELKKQIKELQAENKDNRVTIKALEDKVAKLESKLANTSSSSSSTQIASVETKAAGTYNVIIGSYSQQSSATRKIEKAKKAGFDAYLIDGKVGGMYLVSIGSYDSRTSAKEKEESYESSTDKSAFVKKI